MQLITDRMAIGLSLACVIHCLALPIVLVFVPNFLAIYVDSEYFHLLMVVEYLLVEHPYQVILVLMI